MPTLSRSAVSIFKTKASLPILIVALAPICYLVSAAITQRRIAEAQVTTTGFVLEMNVYHPEGQLVGATTVARRSDGTRVQISPIGPVAWGIAGRRITFMDGRVISLVDTVAAKTTWPLMSKEALASIKARMVHPPPNCVFEGEIFLGEDMVLNHHVVVIKTPNQNSPITNWRAADLGCEGLQFRVETRQADGSFMVTSEGKPVSLQLADPDPELFGEGTNYEELKPSDVQRKILQRIGIPETSELHSQVEPLDREYLRGGTRQ